MPACRRCGGALDREDSCPSCGTSPTASRLPTEAAALPEGIRAGAAGLPTGTVLLGRYRVEGFLGRGGMGTVYRAEDLTLRTEVALKLLPETLRSDPRALERLRSEVRHARRVTHPSVCRVHDIGEVDGQPFLTMELIRGEDLSSLLRRIGRLPNEKALAIARQLCAGLAAAHAQDVLHRDLKPANVMIDERGAVRITDFGLAIRGDEARAGEIAGTPAYMAPEQLRGEPATARSDVYALGLVLHELWSGQRARGGATLEELRRELTRRPPPLGELVPGVEPRVERLVERCLAVDPRERPASARHALALLPGFDPLRAALEAGETPDPSMVAAAGGEGRLDPSIAWALLACCLLALASLRPLSEASMLHRLATPRPVDYLRERAREIVTRISPAAQRRDEAFTFLADRAAIRRAYSSAARGAAGRALARLEPGPVLFVYRQSPLQLVPLARGSPIGLEDPPETVPGMVTVVLSGDGKLVSYRERGAGAATEATFGLLASEAGIPPGELVLPPGPDGPIRFARPSGERVQLDRAGDLSFTRLPAWSSPSARFHPEVEPSTGGDHSGGIYYVIGLFLLVVAGFVARRNWRLGRCDRRGSLAVGGFLALVSSVSLALRAHPVTAPLAAFETIQAIGGQGLFVGVNAWLFLLAIEPYVRRRYPEALSSFSRLTSGAFRDPLVGRHVLVGVGAGLAAAIASKLVYLASPLMGLGELPPPAFALPCLSGLGSAASLSLLCFSNGVLRALASPLLLLVLERLLRRRLLADAAFVLVATVAVGGASAVDLVEVALEMLLLLALLRRAGLLAAIAYVATAFTATNLPMELSPASPYLSSSMPALGIVLALLAYGFRTALGQGRTSSITRTPFPA